MAQARYFSSTAIPTTLSIAISSSVTSIEVPLITGLPTSYPYTVVIDWGVYSGTTLVQEAVLITQAPTGTGPYTFANVTRGYDSTTAQSHAAGATFLHTFVGKDGNDFQAHEAASSGVHGVTGTVMGNPMTAAGDMIYGGASGAPTKLSVGASGQVWTVVSGAPAWASPGAVSLPWYNVKTYGATGNGSTDDSTAINAALNAARTAGGGIVKVPTGTYIVGQILQIGSNTHMIGDGKGATTIRAKTNMNPTVIGNTAGITVLQVYNEAAASNISIEDITFDGNEAGNLNIDVVTGGTSTGGGTATSQLSPVIRIDQVDKLLIRGCEFINSILYNIWLNACTRFIITNNTILSGQATLTAAGSGTTVNSNNTYGDQDGVHMTNSQYGVVANNIIDTGTLWQIGDDAVFIQSLTLATNGGADGGGGGPAASAYIAVTGNVIRSAARGCAMACNGGTANVSYVTVSGNTIWATLSDGIMLTQDSGSGGINHNITVAGNTISNVNNQGSNAGLTLMYPQEMSPPGTGAGWADVNITGNTFVGFGGASAGQGYVYAANGSGLKISDNIFDTMPATSVIQVGDNDGTAYPVTGFVIANNFIGMTASTNADAAGILVIDSQTGTITGNTLIGNGQTDSTGIKIDGQSSAPVGIAVSGNSLKSWGTAIAETNDGVNPNYNIFTGNNCHGNTNFINKLGANSLIPSGTNIIS